MGNTKHFYFEIETAGELPTREEMQSLSHASYTAAEVDPKGYLELGKANCSVAQASQNENDHPRGQSS